MRSLSVVLSCAVLFCVMSSAAPAQASSGKCICPPASKPVVRKHVKKPVAKVAAAAVRVCQERNVQRQAQAVQCTDFCMTANVCTWSVCLRDVQAVREATINHCRQEGGSDAEACVARTNKHYDMELASCSEKLGAASCAVCRPVLEQCGK